MRRIYEAKTVQALMDRFALPEAFDCSGLSFYVSVYEADERISGPREKKPDLQFLSGSEVRIYELWEDGSRMQVEMPQSPLLVLGEIELISHGESRYYIEAKRALEVLCLPIEKHRTLLMNNPQFLLFLLRSVTEKVEIGRRSYQMHFRPLREQVLDMMHHALPDHTLYSVGQTAERLGCSTRQLLRILKQLEAEGTIIKLGRGCYRLK